MYCLSHSVAYATIASIVLTLAACSNTAPIHVWNDRYVVAAKLHDQGKYDKADKHYAQMLKHAPNTETKRLVLYQRALLSKDRGNTEEAIKRFTAIYTKKPIDEHGARSMYWVTRLTPQTDKKLDLLKALVLRYPEHISAEHALLDIQKLMVKQGQSNAYLTWLNGMIPKVKATDLGDMSLLVKARFLNEKLNDQPRAIKAYRALFDFKKDGSLADDALWEMAQIYKKQRNWKQTLLWQSRLVKDRETSWFVGSYDSEFADDARYDMGLIHKNQLKQYNKAIKQFKTFIDEFPTSLLRDDAAWQIVECKRLQSASDYTESLKQFIKSYPESRYIHIAKARLST